VILSEILISDFFPRHISPVENFAVAMAALGEGWHNYHHVFPWDYKTGELGSYRTNITTAFIDFFAKLGWAYDSKKFHYWQLLRLADLILPSRKGCIAQPDRQASDPLW
jgi:hypothetical protein